MTITVTRVTQLFDELGYEPEHRPRGQQAALLARLAGLYAQIGVLDPDRPRPLCDVCPAAASCWYGAEAVRRAGPEGDGSVMLPWVGADYTPGRDVVVLGINPNIDPADPTDPLLEHAITHLQTVPDLGAGDTKPGGSRFPYGAMRSAAALLDLGDGTPIRDREPAALAPLVARTARLQAIKCVPRTRSSAPLPAMWDHCPQTFLAAELDVLQPRFVLALGREPQWALAQVHGYRRRRIASPRLVRGTLWRDGWSGEVYGVPHPSRAAHGDPGERALLRSLAARQRRAAG